MSAPAATAADARRAEVERWLQSVVAAGLAVPVAVASSLRQCLGARLAPITDRVAEPLRVVRSIVELVAGASPGREAEAERETVVVPGVGGGAEPANDGAAADLPIDEYESLAASQVVARLANLTVEELGAVRSFEAARRGRRTIIGRIDQLLAAHDTVDAG